MIRSESDQVSLLDEKEGKGERAKGRGCDNKQIR